MQVASRAAITWSLTGDGATRSTPPSHTQSAHRYTASALKLRTSTLVHIRLICLTLRKGQRWMPSLRHRLLSTVRPMPSRLAASSDGRWKCWLISSLVISPGKRPCVSSRRRGVCEARRSGSIERRVSFSTLLRQVLPPTRHMCPSASRGRPPRDSPPCCASA